MDYYLGVDQTQPAAPIIRMISPTDIQRVSARMSTIIKDYYPGVDLFNADLWRKLGVTTLEGPVVDFLSRMIALERERQDSLDETTQGDYKTILRQRFGYKVDDIVDYTRSYLQAVREGVVPDSIRRPFEYTPTTVAQDVAAAATGGVKVLTPLLLGAVALYVLIGVFLPKAFGTVARR